MDATEIALRLGLRRYPRSWRGRCPACDYPGTFSVRAGRDGRPLLFCASCRDPDGLADAVARATGKERQLARRDGGDAAADRQRNRERALALWRGSESASGTLADHYLTARGRPGLAASPALRFRGDCPHPERARLPALVALACDVAGELIGIHRTYLARDGSKARVAPDKASLGPVWGGAIRLQPIETDKPLVIGEGIESSASASRLMGLPAWAGISAGNMAKGLALPPEVRRVVIVAASGGDDAARAAYRRFIREGRRVETATSPGGTRNSIEILHGRGAA